MRSTSEDQRSQQGKDFQKNLSKIADSFLVVQRRHPDNRSHLVLCPLPPPFPGGPRLEPAGGREPGGGRGVPGPVLANDY